VYISYLSQAITQTLVKKKYYLHNQLETWVITLVAQTITKKTKCVVREREYLLSFI